MGDVERSEIGADHRHHHLDRLGAHDRQPFSLRLLRQRVAKQRCERRSDRLEIFSRIKPVRNGADIVAESLAVTEERRTRQHVDLCAGVIDVIFARHLIAGEAKQIGQCVAEHRATAMADMHRPGRIGRDVFDVDGLIAADVAFAEIATEPNGRPQRVEPRRRLQREIDEARPRNLDFRHQIIGAELRRIGIGKVARLFPSVLGEHHGDVGRHVAVGRIPRRLDGCPRQIDAGRQIASRNQFVAQAANTIEHFGKDVRRGHQIPVAERSCRRRAPNAIPGSSQKAADARRVHSGRSCRQ